LPCNALQIGLADKHEFKLIDHVHARVDWKRWNRKIVVFAHVRVDLTIGERAARVQEPAAGDCSMRQAEASAVGTVM